MAVDAIVESWCDRDRQLAFIKNDHEAIAATGAVRAFIVEQLLKGTPDPSADRDLFHAFAVLGKLVADRGGSPTLAAAIVDDLLPVLPAPPLAAGFAAVPEWAVLARAALVEAFALARREGARAEAAARWEYPGCAVGLADGTVAIAAGFPDEDEEALHAWASRVAHDAALAGVRRVVVCGSEAAEKALESAFEIAGITRVPGRPPPVRRISRR